MQYISPLRIFGDEKQIDLSAANLEKLGAAVPPGISLSKNSTVKIDGKIYNRNQLRTAVDMLKTDADFHLQLFKNKPLLAFLEEGDTTIFRENGRIDELFNPYFKTKVKPYFTQRFSQILYQNATQPDFQSIKQLKDIRESYFKMPKDFEQDAYGKTYNYLEKFIANGNQKLSNPFRPGEGSRLKKEALVFFDLHKLNVFKNLPDYFADLIEQYGTLAHNYVLHVLRRNPHPEQATRPVARVLLNACRIDAELSNDRKSKELVPLLEQILAKKEVETKEFVGGKWRGWIGFAVVIGFLLFFAFFGELPAQFQKKSAYQKSVERYNFYRKNRNQPKKKTEPKVNISTEKLLGAWQADLFFQKARMYRTLHFYTNNIGQSEYQFVTEQGEKQARLTAWFHWEIDNSRRESQFDLLKRRHRGEVTIEGDTSIMSQLYQDVFEGVQSRMENELYEEVIKFPDDDYFLMANKRYYKNEDYNNGEFSAAVQSNIQRMQQFEQNLQVAKSQFSSIFQKDSLANMRLRFSVSLLDDVVYINENQKIGFLYMTDSTSYFQPWKWTKGKGYDLQGAFKNADYLRNDTVRTKDLEMLHHPRKGFRFREFEESTVGKNTE